jgi:hypothetical protein
MRWQNLVRQAWLGACLFGALAAPILPPFLAAGVILVGLILVVQAKDQHAPTLTWPTAMRAYWQAHQWTLTSKIVVWMGGVWSVSQIADHDARGVYLACLALMWLFHSALPVRASSVEAPVGS